MYVEKSCIGYTQKEYATAQLHNCNLLNLSMSLLVLQLHAIVSMLLEWKSFMSCVTECDETAVAELIDWAYESQFVRRWQFGRPVTDRDTGDTLTMSFRRDDPAIRTEDVNFIVTTMWANVERTGSQSLYCNETYWLFHLHFVQSNSKPNMNQIHYEA